MIADSEVFEQNTKSLENDYFVPVIQVLILLFFPLRTCPIQ